MHSPVGVERAVSAVCTCSPAGGNLRLKYTPSAMKGSVMLVFVDESGDTGMKLGRGSSEYFVVTAVRFAENSEALRCDERIASLRAELRVTPEFHFANTSHKKRLAFLDAVNQFDFTFNSVVFNKRRLYGPAFRYKRSFYKAAVNYTFQNILEHLDHAKVVLDKTGDKDFTRSMQSYLKRQTRRTDGTPRIKKVSSEDSKKNNLLQLADMLCGAVARSFLRTKKEARAYRSAVSQREEHVQYWPSDDNEKPAA